MGDKHKENQWDKSFDLRSEIEAVGHISILRRKKKYRRSILDRFRGELTALYSSGLSLAQLALWLQHRKKIKISRSAIHRKLREWPEIVLRRGK